MNETLRYALIVLLSSAVGLAAVLANRLTEKVKVPVAVLVLVGAAAAVHAVPAIQSPSERTVERIITVALVLVLFDGGMHIGVKRFRAAAVPILSVGVLGTGFVAAGAALLLHYACGIDWYLAVLVATAVAPTDPAVVFSVLGKREIAGRSSTILEGESGMNDPVGISLMAGLIAAGGLSVAGFVSVGTQFALQMGIGLAVGLIGGRALLMFMRRVALPSEGLYPLRTLACCLMLYGIATLAHGSGFLAVFVAGIVIGDARAPYKPEIKRFHAALSGLAEIVAFAVLGLTVDLRVLTHPEVWIPGLVLGVALSAAIRPLAAGACLVRVQLKRNERAFILFAGLKGAVPILLGELLRAAHIADAERLYGIVVVVVIFSVLVQGSLVPGAAKLLRLPMRTVQTQPWEIGVRLADEPHGVHRFSVASGSAAQGCTVEELSDRVGDIWVSIVVRATGLVAVRGDTELQAGDEVVILADPELRDSLAALFAKA
ncbi:MULTISPECIES: cation:proton antiporter domain-containing protein [Mycobacterium]|uniref:Sodium/hydrogen exchanger n=1 Tax=Mycobacterium kiyosense TaxID=2871094 RepID=A0A9P3UWQ4_9MYCO|nr:MULTISPECIES: cation:proton antiporter [Mycobacterium]BDE13473.1 sodium/hydrogen exchanger [Mycobacterium sp. 20KCMC460]GLB83191.1 sodium/hydrogen exchanger [Mycobacterium kiyosense]GLB88405.1 sodium/hydrogen exchanger [Mycobacterium kiyosense]GLB94669.1 sodium/hydrogen exchanger [Mycobacterium kiyosense]GLC01301.1 sodium/hydrogen exchanger [Mycobacterium kiyosense]